MGDIDAVTQIIADGVCAHRPAAAHGDEHAGLPARLDAVLSDARARPFANLNPSEREAADLILIDATFGAIPHEDADARATVSKDILADEGIGAVAADLDTARAGSAHGVLAHLHTSAIADKHANASGARNRIAENQHVAAASNELYAGAAAAFNAVIGDRGGSATAHAYPWPDRRSYGIVAQLAAVSSASQLHAGSESAAQLARLKQRRRSLAHDDVTANLAQRDARRGARPNPKRERRRACGGGCCCCGGGDGDRRGVAAAASTGWQRAAERG